MVKLTWARLASYDVTANRLHRNAERIERSILLFGIAVTFVALLQNELSIHNVDGWWDHVFHWSTDRRAGARVDPDRDVGEHGDQQAVGAPALGRRSRSAARSSAGAPAPAPTVEDAKDPGAHGSSVEHLVERVSAIEARLMKTEVGSSTLADVGDGPHVSLAGAHDEDDGVSRLGPDGYFRLRIEHQLDYYRSKVRRLARTVARAAGREHPRRRGRYDPRDHGQRGVDRLEHRGRGRGRRAHRPSADRHDALELQLRDRLARGVPVALAGGARRRNATTSTSSASSCVPSGRSNRSRRAGGVT